MHIPTLDNQTIEWIDDIIATTPRWPAERINAHVQRGWSFIGISREKYEQRKQEILDYVAAKR